MKPSAPSSLVAISLIATSLGGCLGDQVEPVAELDEATPDIVERRAERPCNGAREAGALGVFGPEPPSAYSLTEAPDCNDATVICVTPATLQGEVDDGTEVIVLRDGVYTANDLDGDFLSIDGQELWAEHVGGAILEFGIEAGGNGIQHAGSRLRGLVFDIDDATHVPDQLASGTTIISAWGDATHLRIDDTEFHGNGLVDTGIYVASPSDLQLERLEIDGLRRYGTLVEGAGPVNTPVFAQDIRVDDVSSPLNPKHGVGLRFSESVVLNRARVRDVRWAGIVVNGEAMGSQVTSVDVDRVGIGSTTGAVGVYLDNTTRHTTIQDFCVGPQTRIGVNSEWDNWCDHAVPGCDTPTHDMFPRAHHTTVKDGLVEAWQIGVHFDQGTVAGNVEDMIFRNYLRAGIVFHNNLSDANLWPNYDDGSTEANNDFQEAQNNCSTCDVTFSVWTDPTPQCVGQPAC
ncbi:MAG: right-handed parallel beta-helix repeat-containing protein [Myxococcota bacterium]